MLVKEHTRGDDAQGRVIHLHSRQKGGECVNVIKDTEGYEKDLAGVKHATKRTYGLK